MIKQINHSEGLIAAPFTPMDARGHLDLSVIPAYAGGGLKGHSLILDF